MLINSTERDQAQRYQTEIFGTAITLFVLISFWELTNHQGSLAWMIVVPLVLATYFFDGAVVLPLLSKPLRYYHGIFLLVYFLLGPSNATLVAALALMGRLIKSYFRFSTMVTDKLLEYLSSLVAVWLSGKIYLLTMAVGQPSSVGSLFPTIFVMTSYCLLYTLSKAAGTSLVRSVSFVSEWKQRYLVSTLLFLSVAVGVGLVNHYASLLGNEAYLLAIPFALFVLTSYRIYSLNLAESSRRLGELSQLQTSIIETLALAIDAKDHPTHGHARRVQAYAVGIAKSLGIDSKNDVEALSTAALLHDIGKLAIPEYILSKPGKLTDTEFAKMMRHAEIGANILEPIRFPYPVVPTIRYHHERHNGSGYPHGLKGDEIPLGARILAVADTFDALTAQRTYRTPLTVVEAIELIRRESGLGFDPEVVQAFSKVAAVLVEEVSTLDLSKYSNSTHPQRGAPEAEQEYKLWLRKKGFTEIASTHREIYALHEIFQTVGRTLNLEDTLRIICTKLQSVVPFTSGVVYLRNKKTDVIYSAMVIGEHAEQLSRSWISLGEGLTGYAVAFSQRVVNADPALDFQHLTYLERPHQLVNGMVFPLTVKEDTLGAIALYSSEGESGIFTDDHVRLMETVSERAAVSIQNAMSFEYYEENSLTDPLTGLPNSRFMFMAFDQNAKKAERAREKMAVLVMDLNSFKEINDQCGHKVGDEVLIKVSEILQKEMRKYDTCVRYAGDEFVAFLYNAERATAEKIVHRIRKAVQSLVLKIRSGKELRLGISVGLSMYPEDGTELTQLFTVADSQMYNDKFESKVELARQAEGSLRETLEVDDEIEFKRAN